jgi:hypothetical protein
MKFWCHLLAVLLIWSLTVVVAAGVGEPFSIAELGEGTTKLPAPSQTGADADLDQDDVGAGRVVLAADKSRTSGQFGFVSHQIADEKPHKDRPSTGPPPAAPHLDAV